MPIVPELADEFSAAARARATELGRGDRLVGALAAARGPARVRVGGRDRLAALGQAVDLWRLRRRPMGLRSCGGRGGGGGGGEGDGSSDC